ncbi:MAG: transcriptional regulator, LuxR family [Microvirga sp.]|jgi:DNA-binding CsgD family transcriptional regulator|nr:transcriptional regulator, LuxR family [Microvirga sp.]
MMTDRRQADGSASPFAVPNDGLARFPEMFGGLVDRLGTPAFHPALRSALYQISRFNSCVIMSFCEEEEPTVHERCSTLNPDRFRHFYVKQAYRLDPFYQAARENRPIGVSRCCELSGSGFTGSAYFTSYYKDIPFIDEIGLLCPVEKGHTVHISLGRFEGSKRFDGSLIADLNCIEPLIAALVRRHIMIGSQPECPVDPQLAVQQDTTVSIVDLLWMREFHATQREMEVAAHVLSGYSNPSIALRLGISQHTVKVHRKRLYGKLSISSQAELFTIHMRRRHHH